MLYAILSLKEMNLQMSIIFQQESNLQLYEKYFNMIA